MIHFLIVQHGPLAVYNVSMSNCVMAEPTTYKDVLAGNIRAARGRAQLSQAACAARMKGLGFTQIYGATIGAIERGERQLSAAEVLGLSLALQTTVPVLTRVPPEYGAYVILPNGQRLPAQRVEYDQGEVTWDANVPKITEASGRMPLTELRVAELRRELDEFERFVRDVRQEQLGELTPPRPDEQGAVDIRPQRPGEPPSEPLERDNDQREEQEE